MMMVKRPAAVGALKSWCIGGLLLGVVGNGIEHIWTFSYSWTEPRLLAVLGGEILAVTIAAIGLGLLARAARGIGRRWSISS
jgi:hypothetical protein